MPLAAILTTMPSGNDKITKRHALYNLKVLLMQQLCFGRQKYHDVKKLKARF